MPLTLLGGSRRSQPVTLPALTRRQLSVLPTRFGGGVWAATAQLGRIPSWGPELGMLTSLSDRTAVRQAHLQAGAKAIWFCLYVHYQEDGVAYPNGKAGWNDFTGPNLSQAVALAQETAADGLYPFVQLGGDELGAAWVQANIQSIADAFRAGGLQGRVCFTPTFDSDADDDWSAPTACNWAPTNLAIRAALGDDFALANWLPAGWARLGFTNTTPVGPAEACVDRWSLEGPGGMGEFLAPWPAIVTANGSPWDSEHQVYTPQYVSDPSIWNQFVEQVGRRAQPGKWAPPPDAPYNRQGGLGIGGPLNGQPVTVSCDSLPPPSYTTTGQACVFEESYTYDWTHQTGITPEQIDQVRAGALACGCDAVG